LKEISEKTSIPLKEVKKCYEEFEGIVYMDQTNSISKPTFDFNFFFDKRYRANSKNIDLFLDQLFDAFDRNQDGALSFQEFLVGKILFESKSSRDNLKIFFRLFDISKDTRIEKNEIEQVLTILGRLDTIGPDNTYSSFAQEMLQDLDFDKDGSISEDEFIEV
jgi:Ca2+-binding EF-hand superfamily protein